MRLGNHKLFRVLAVMVGAALLGASGGIPSDARSDASKTAPANRGKSVRGVCAALTDEVAVITGLRLRQPPLELSAPGEGLLRGCTWTEEGVGANVLAMTKEPADKYEEHDENNYMRNFPDRFKRLEGLGDRAFVSPTVNDGWAACALRGSETFFVEIEGKATTEEQARRLLRLAIGRL